MALNESIVEEAALEWFGVLGYAVGHGPQLAPGEPAAERDSFGGVVLVGRLRGTIRRLNPFIPGEAREEPLRKVRGLNWKFQCDWPFEIERAVAACETLEEARKAAQLLPS